MGAAALALVGCGGDDEDDGGQSTGGAASPQPQAPQASGEPKPGGIFNLMTTGGGDDSLNPITNNRMGYALDGQQTYDQMFSARVGEKAPYVLEAAEGIEQPDALTVTFKLKPGMKYQNLPPVNGRDVRASDIKAVHEYVRDESRANRSFQTQSMDSVEAPDDQTVVFKLKAPNAYALTATQLGDTANGSIIPVEILDRLDTHQPIGSGPYINTAHELGSRFAWRKNPDFRDADKGLPYADERVYLLFSDQVAFESAFRANQTDIYFDTPATAVEGILRELQDQIYEVEYPDLSPFTYNIGGRMDFNKLKADVRAREAFYRTMDRQQYIDLLFNGKGTLPTGLLTEAHSQYQLDYDQTAEYLDNRDLAEARKLLEAAGVLGQEWEIMFFAPNATNEQACQILQQQMGEVGLQTLIRGLPVSEGFVKATAGEWHLFAGSHPAYGSPQIPMRQQHMESGSRFGYTGLGDAEIDSLVEKAEQALDFEAHVNFVKEAQLVSIQKFTGYVLLMSQVREDLLYNKVQGYDFDPADTYLPRTGIWLDA